MTQLADLITPCSLNFCPGCGNFAIWSAFKNAAVAGNWDCTNTAIVAGIGCHGHMVNFVKLPSFEGLHGRAIPVATGIKLANNNLNVFVFTGDGDGLAEGGNHFIHAARRNHDITVILHDNAIYGLTTGQTSPRTPKGYKSKSTPLGNLDMPFYPMALAIASGATFVARVYASDIAQVADVLVKANNHHGFALVDILQPCVSFNKEYDHTYYHENTYYLDDAWDRTNKSAALTKAMEWGSKQIALGILYEINQPSYEDQLTQKSSVMTPPVKRDLADMFKKYI